MLEILLIMAAGIGLGSLLFVSSEDEEQVENLEKDDPEVPHNPLPSTEDTGSILDLLDDVVSPLTDDALDNPELSVKDEQDQSEVPAEDTPVDVISDMRLVIGTKGADHIVATGEGQVVYHNELVISTELEHLNPVQSYENYRDNSADTITTGDGNDSIFAGTGDEITSGGGSDTVHLFFDILEKNTVLHDFESGKDRVVIYVPEEESGSIDVYELMDNFGFTLEIETSRGVFSFHFPGLTQHLETELVSDEYDPEINPLVFIDTVSSTSADIFVLSKTGYDRFDVAPTA